MYKTLNSTTVRHLGLRTNGSAVAFRRVNQHRPAAISLRLVVLRPNAAAQRGLHLNRQLVRTEGKASKAVAEEKETMTSRAAALAKEQQAKAAAAAAGTVAAPANTAVKPKKTLWTKIKEEAVHYWHGTQLLGFEVRVSSKLTWKLLHGGKLTRREHRQVRSCIDLQSINIKFLSISYVVLHLILCDLFHLHSSLLSLLWNFYYLSPLNFSPTCYPVLMKANLKRFVTIYYGFIRLEILINSQYRKRKRWHY
jgi:hypothetical protein